MDVDRRYLLLVSYPSDIRGRLEVTTDTLTVEIGYRYLLVPYLIVVKFEVSYRYILSPSDSRCRILFPTGALLTVDER